MVRNTTTVTQNRGSMTIVEGDVRAALNTMGFQVRDGAVAKNDVAADGEAFRGRVGDILRKNKTDIPIEKGALSILKIVEDAYRDTANFEAVRSPDKAGGRLLKLESRRCQKVFKATYTPILSVS